MRRREAAVTSAYLLIPDEAVIVQLLPGPGHRLTGRAQEAIVSPEGAADEANLPDDYSPAMQQMDAYLAGELATRGQGALYLGLVELVIALSLS